jgi:hypothetical protein
MTWRDHTKNTTDVGPQLIVLLATPGVSVHSIPSVPSIPNTTSTTSLLRPQFVAMEPPWPSIHAWSLNSCCYRPRSTSPVWEAESRQDPQTGSSRNHSFLAAFRSDCLTSSQHHERAILQSVDAASLREDRKVLVVVASGVLPGSEDRIALAEAIRPFHPNSIYTGE